MLCKCQTGLCTSTYLYLVRIHSNCTDRGFSILQKVVDHIQQTRAEATVIAPFWRAQPWLYLLQEMSVCPPLKLPCPQKMCVPCLDSTPEAVKNQKWSLYAWIVSGKNV